MFYIATEDLLKIQATIGKVIKALGIEVIYQIEQAVELGDGLDTIRVRGRWIKNTMRIVIRIKGDKGENQQ